MEKAMEKRLLACFAFTLLSFSFPYALCMSTMQEPKVDHRVALVIGNGAYDDAPLKNPVNDATDMAHALREAGFDVVHTNNIKQNDMKRVIREFGDKARNSEVALFYYAGHAIQVNGENYLVPVGVTIQAEQDIEYESV